MSTPQAIGDAMREISIPRATMPKELRGLCAGILQRAIEIRVSTPVVAYWCCFAAAQRAMAFKGPVPGKNLWLLSLVEVLEEMKKILGQDERVNNEAAGSAYVESFAILMFAAADRMDRAGKTDMKTSQQYAIAQQFFEVLNCFDVPMSENAKEKLSYARWKIRDIGAAIREGRTPVSGPPIPETDDDLLASLGAGSPLARSPGTGSPSGSTPRRTSAEGERRGSSSSLKRPNVPPPITIDDLDDEVPRRTVSETWSTMATPGVDDSEPRLPSPPGAVDLGRVLSGDSGKSAGSGGSRGSGSSGHTATGPPAPGPGPGPGPDKPDKSVRFMGPDGAPLSPAQTMSSVAVFDETLVPLPSPESAYQPLPPPVVPPLVPTAHTLTPRNPSPTKAPPPQPSPPKPRAPSLPTPPPPSLASTVHPPAPPPSLASTAHPPAPPPSLASTAPPPSLATAHPPAPPPSLASTAYSYAPPPPASAPPAPPKQFNWRDRDQVKKHAKFAISALEFDDYDEAKSQLLRALAYFD